MFISVSPHTSCTKYTYTKTDKQTDILCPRNFISSLIACPLKTIMRVSPAEAILLWLQPTDLLLLVS